MESNQIVRLEETSEALGEHSNPTQEGSPGREQQGSPQWNIFVVLQWCYIKLINASTKFGEVMSLAARGASESHSDWWICALALPLHAPGFYSAAVDHRD